MKIDSTPPSIPAQRSNSLFAVVRIVLATAALSALALRAVTGAPTTNHFAFLADAFNRGEFSVGALPDNYADTITVGSRVYLPMGPAPAMLMMPWVGIGGVTFDEFWLALIVTALNMWLMWLVLRRLAIADPSQRRWMLVLFFGGTIYFATLILGRSWFLAHLVATLFLLLAINEALQRGSALRIGLLLGMAFLTRASTVFALSFFITVMWQDQRWTERARWLAACALGLMVPMLFFFYYNDARFGDIFQTGYARALPGAKVLQEAMRYGLVSLAHVPKNFYMLFLSVPQPVPGIDSPVLQFPWILPSRWGMSIFFTTPAFVYAFLANHRTRVVRAAWVAVLLILPFLLTYYGIGYNQFGYRYAIDLYPFLFINTALGLHARWGRVAKILILVSVVINIWGAWCALLGTYAEPL